MPTRDDEANRWQATSLNSRKAAQHLLVTECYRSSISRSYYAAYSAITAALVRQGITLGYGGNNPRHAGLPVLVVNNLTLLRLAVRYDLNKALRRLYAARIEADYDPAPNVSEMAALAMLRDLNFIYALLNVEGT